MLQRARVDVDERGTKRRRRHRGDDMRAVAVPRTPSTSSSTGPFTWAIEHAPTGTLLFVGRVHHPTERSD